VRIRRILFLPGVLLFTAGLGFSASAEERAGERRLGIELAPEVWYAKWQPNFGDTGNCISNDCSALRSTYKVAPALVSGIVVLGVFGRSSLFLNYRGIGKLSGDAAATNGEIARWQEVIAGGLFWLSGDWFLDSKLTVGEFTGHAEGTEWTRGVGTTVRSLPINTTWVEGELDVVYPVGFALQAREDFHFGLVAGYRINRYRVPALVEVYDDKGLQRISFEDTSLLVNSLVLGLRELPDTKRHGWGISVPQIKGLIGVSRASSQHLNSLGLAAGAEGEAGLRYSHPTIRVFLGYRAKMLFVSAGSRPVDGTSANQSYRAAAYMQITDRYHGPALTLTVRF